MSYNIYFYFLISTHNRAFPDSQLFIDRMLLYNLQIPHARRLCFRLNKSWCLIMNTIIDFMEADCRIPNQSFDLFRSIKHIYFNKFQINYRGFFLTTNHFKLTLKDRTVHDTNIAITCICKVN